MYVERVSPRVDSTAKTCNLCARSVVVIVFECQLDQDYIVDIFPWSLLLLLLRCGVTRQGNR